MTILSRALLLQAFEYIKGADALVLRTASRETLDSFAQTPFFSAIIAPQHANQVQPVLSCPAASKFCAQIVLQNNSPVSYSSFRHLRHATVHIDRNTKKDNSLFSLDRVFRTLSIVDFDFLNADWIPFLSSQSPHLRRLIVVGESSKFAKHVCFLRDFFPQLRTLHFGSCHTFSEEHSPIFNLANLSTLTIGTSSVKTWWGRNMLAVCPNLRVLKIGAENKVGKAGAAAIANCLRLVHLEIGEANCIGTKGVFSFEKLANTLHYLKIENSNEIGNSGIRAIGKLIHLNTLHINEAIELSDEALSTIVGLSHLQTLSLGYFEYLSDKHLRMLASMTNLSTLILGHMLFSPDTQWVFPPNLTSLTIGSFNHVTAETIKHIARSLPKLSRLEIQEGNKLGPDESLADAFSLFSTTGTLTTLSIGYGNRIGRKTIKTIASLQTLTDISISLGNGMDDKQEFPIRNMDTFTLKKILSA